MAARGSIQITAGHIERLAQVEAHVHYGEPPPPNLKPFVIVQRGSPVLLSAPHGSRTLRAEEGWHQEEEYTAGIALLLSELCGVSAIATIWRTDDSDPNDSDEDHSAYKRALRRIAQAENTRLIIDLHGASAASPHMAPSQLVDLGLGVRGDSLTTAVQSLLLEALERRLGRDACSRDGRKGYNATKRTRIRAFCRRELNMEAVQVEMKPAVRVVQRRVDATSYGKPVADGGGPYTAPRELVQGMLQALADFIQYYADSVSVFL